MNNFEAFFSGRNGGFNDQMQRQNFEKNKKFLTEMDVSCFNVVLNF